MGKFRCSTVELRLGSRTESTPPREVRQVDYYHCKHKPAPFLRRIVRPASLNMSLVCLYRGWPSVCGAVRTEIPGWSSSELTIRNTSRSTENVSIRIPTTATDVGNLGIRLANGVTTYVWTVKFHFQCSARGTIVQQAPAASPQFST